jgi:hypothetical protein
MIPLRWPLHPKPIAGESLSSWLQRIASCYNLTVKELLESDLGHSEVSLQSLDKEPPRPLVELIATRTGKSVRSVRSMTFAGFVPCIFDTLVAHEGYFEKYVGQNSVLLPAADRPLLSPDDWIPWFPKKPQGERGCRFCLASYPDAAFMLYWQLTLITSCPQHGLLLEPVFVLPGASLHWKGKTPKKSARLLRLLDQRSWDALFKGFVQLPGQRVSGAEWFRLLRTILDELNTPFKFLRSKHVRPLSQIWEATGQRSRAGERAWRPFEDLSAETRNGMLVAAAEAMDRIQRGLLSPPGTEGALFSSKRFESGSHVGEHLKPSAYVSNWQEAYRLLDKAVKLAKNDPEEAQRFRLMLLFGKRDEKSIREVDKLLLDAGIEVSTLPKLANELHLTS